MIELFLPILQIAGARMVQPACLGMQNHTGNKKINDSPRRAQRTQRIKKKGIME